MVEDTLEEEMATHSKILAWKTPWTAEPGGLQSMGLQRVGHDLVTQHIHAWLQKQNNASELTIKRSNGCVLDKSNSLLFYVLVILHIQLLEITELSTYFFIAVVQSLSCV